MRRLIAVLLVFPTMVNAQLECLTVVANKDAAIGFHDNFNTAGNNYGSASQLAGYCIHGNQGGVNMNRGLIEFDLTGLPLGATIISASISLYATGPIGTLNGHVSNTNQAYLQRVTTSWNENTVTWNNQPSSTALNQVILPSSTSSNQDYINVNVTDLVLDMASNSNYGFLLKQTNETTHRGLLFCSSDHSNPSKRPTLKICYSIPVSPVDSVLSIAPIEDFEIPTVTEIDVKLQEMMSYKGRIEIASGSGVQLAREYKVEVDNTEILTPQVEEEKSIVIGNSNLLGLVIFPNPSNGNYNVKTNNSVDSSDLHYEIYNLVGELIKTDKVNADLIEINISEFSKGIYLFRLVNSITGEVNTKEIVLN
jgi:hypothetical protein